MEKRKRKHVLTNDSDDEFDASSYKGRFDAEKRSERKIENENQTTSSTNRRKSSNTSTVTGACLSQNI